MDLSPGGLLQSLQVTLLPTLLHNKPENIRLSQVIVSLVKTKVKISGSVILIDAILTFVRKIICLKFH